MHKKPIRLFWGENYSEKPQEVQEAIRRAVDTSISSINLYPGSLYQEVIELIAKTLHVNSDQVVLGHGIEGLIHTTSLAFLNTDKKGGMFYPSFFVFDNNLKRYQRITVPCRYDQPVDFNQFKEAITNTNVFFLASPNTATGNYLLTHEQIEEVARFYKGLFVVDECYYGIGTQTVLDLIPKYGNILIYRGITKVMGLGGLRLGFAIAQKPVIDKLKFHFTDIELDPLSNFSLQIFKETYPFFDVLAKTTNSFFENFLTYMQKEFVNDRLIKNQTTFCFLDLKNYTVPAFQIMNYLSDHGYIMSDTKLSDNSSIHFPELLELTPPPVEYWDDFAKTLRIALNQK